MSTATNGRAREHRTPEVRFWEKVNKESPDGCWVWTAFVRPNGYGGFDKTLAHRFSYELHKGPIPAGMHVDHLCRNRACVNPDHLDVVEPAENTRRGLGPAAWHRVRAEESTGACPNGHRWTPETTYYRPSDGFRECRTCRRERAAKRDYRAERRARRAA